MGEKSDIRRWNKKIDQLILEVMREHEPEGDWYWEQVEELVDKLKALRKPEGGV